MTHLEIVLETHLLDDDALSPMSIASNRVFPFTVLIFFNQIQHFVRSEKDAGLPPTQGC